MTYSSLIIVGYQLHFDFLPWGFCMVLHLLIWHNIHATCRIYYCTIACYPISCDYSRFRPASNSSIAEFASKFACRPMHWEFCTIALHFLLYYLESFPISLTLNKWSIQYTVRNIIDVLNNFFGAFSEAFYLKLIKVWTERMSHTQCYYNCLPHVLHYNINFLRHLYPK